MLRDVERSSIFFFALLTAAIVIAFGSSPPPTSATELHRITEKSRFHGKTMLVGIVLPEGCLPGHVCSASLVTDPDDFADTRGIVVRKFGCRNAEAPMVMRCCVASW